MACGNYESVQRQKMLAYTFVFLRNLVEFNF